MKHAVWIVPAVVTAIIVGIVAVVGLPFLTAENAGWDTPVSRNDALRRLDIRYSFPDSARDIYLRHRREGTQQNFLYVRFTVDPADVAKHVEDSVRLHRVAFPADQPRRIALPAKSTPSVGWFPPPPSWWQASKITQGYLIQLPHGGPVFWFDADHNVLYHYEQS